MPNTYTTPLRRVKVQNLPDDLLTYRELAELCWTHLRVRLNPSKLCRLRAKGLPFVQVSKRGFRYQYEASATWILANAGLGSRSGQNRLRNASLNALAFNPRMPLLRASGGEE